MYSPTTRVLTVLELLQAHHRMTGGQLAERLEVDTRTVRRYIGMLQDLGIPVMAERGRYGAYRLMPGYKLPPLMFSDDEALALVLGLLAARRLGLAATAPAVEGALAKVERVLPAALRERVRAVQQALVIDWTPHSEDTPEQETVVTFSMGAQQTRRVRLRYQSSQHAETERTIEPYGLVYRAGRWYAPANCLLRQGMRVFRLDRVREATLLDEQFTRPAEFDSLGYVIRSLAMTPGAWEVCVVLSLPLEEARWRVPADLATLEQTAGGVALHCFVEDLDWMARFVVNLRCPFVVRQPAALTASLRALAAEIVAATES
ncbi:MAG: helix-turn-helix transcriptional regulator [Ktedonobacterales bacterium]